MLITNTIYVGSLKKEYEGKKIKEARSEFVRIDENEIFISLYMLSSSKFAVP